VDAGRQPGAVELLHQSWSAVVLLTELGDQPRVDRQRCSWAVATAGRWAPDVRDRAQDRQGL